MGATAEAERQYAIQKQQEQKQRQAEAQKEVSRIFYRFHGSPEYGREYAPFKVPEGYRVEHIEETPKGLEVTFAPRKEPQKGIAETLVSYKTTPMVDVRQYSSGYWLAGMKPQEVHPFAGIAGVIAPTEALVYSIGRLAGFETPEIPKTWTMEYGSEYAAGVLSGEILLSIGISKALAATPLGKAIGKLETRAIQKITRPLIGTRLDEWLYVRSGYWRALHPISEQIVATKGTPLISEGKFLYPSWGTREAAEMGWMLEIAPKTSALSIGKPIIETIPKAYQHLIFRAGAISVGYLPQELSFIKSEKGEAILGKLVSTPKQIPYLTEPLLHATTSTPFLTSLLATFGVSYYSRQRQYGKVTPITMPKIESAQRLKSYTSTASAIKEKLVPKQIGILKATTKQKIAPIQKTSQMVRQMQKTTQTMMPPTTITRTSTIKPFFDIEPRKHKRRKTDFATGLIGRYKRQYPIATPQQALKMMMGGKKK
jgi:hypothetical protein